ncbi:hypothetical protein [Zhenhengia yiwuensis]|uniref:Uncharacterized protein n=1 Tax=Zhenhengia yiwuensis TaxID=2763666 RepID=A0A926EIG9_9FIRM|nr:hypothetical protein [Zhenhengia yiwuensis]MBC8580184.1 hypothetical protein [Zhenhengia yiwuensis]
MNIIVFALIGTVLYLTSLKLEAETSGKDSVSYKRFKKVGIISLSMTWGGITVLSIMLLILKNL